MAFAMFAMFVFLVPKGPWSLIGMGLLAYLLVLSFNHPVEHPTDFPDVGFEVRQTDYEGEFVGWIHEAANSRGLILNPGAWSHYSYAIHDALEVISVPKVEVHLSNIHSREEAWRHASVISPVVDAVVAGMGDYGYRAAAGYIIAGSSG